MKDLRFLCATCLLLIMTAASYAQKITGVVIDKSTGDSIPMASAIYKGHNVMVAASIDGRFTIARHNGWVLTFSAIGYASQNVTIGANTPSHLVVKMVPTSKQLDNVVIQAKKEKYTRKNNPAVELMKRVIAAKKRTDLQNYPFYQYTKYQKLSMSLDDYKIKIDSITHRPTLWSSQAEISPLNGKWILPISVDETVTQHFYRKDPQKERNIIQGEQSSGVNQLLVTGDMLNTILKEVFNDVNIYDDYVQLLRHPFLSPIGSGATSFYRYYIMDTLKVDNDSCYHLHFMPNNQQDIGFRGDLYILKDSSLHVKKCELTLPKSSDVNFVRTLHITQKYTQIPVSDNPADSTRMEWVLTQDDMWAELSAVGKWFLVVRNTRLSDYAFDALPKSLFRGKGLTKRVGMARNQSEDFWNKYRVSGLLSDKESNVNSFMENLKKSKAMRIPLFIVKTLLENYIETSKPGKPSKFDFGPFMSTFSHNFADGFRVRLGGTTTPNLSKRVFARGYVTYAFGSDRIYHNEMFTYSFNKKSKTYFEFPQRSISFENEFDVMSPSDKFLESSKDNMLVSNIMTETVRQLYRYSRQTLHFTWETDWCLYFDTYLRTEEDTPVGDMHFIKQATDEELSHIRTTEWYVGLKYCPGQTLLNTKQKRIPIDHDNPEYTITHNMGIKGFLGGQYTSNQTDVALYYRKWFGSWGHIDMHLRGAIQWNKVPFTMLMTPAICLSYIEQPGTFNMLHNMEFFMDRKVSLSLAWDLNGKILNRIPLLKKLKLREYIAFRGVWGTLTDKNNPNVNTNDPMLFKFPEGSSAMTGGTPYMECSAGIHNILKFFCVDYVYRINYHKEGTHNHGVRFGFEFTF